MSHCKPHLENGLCLCDCRKCTLPLPWDVNLCICKDCDTQNCGLHVTPGPDMGGVVFWGDPATLLASEYAPGGTPGNINKSTAEGVALGAVADLRELTWRHRT